MKGFHLILLVLKMLLVSTGFTMTSSTHSIQKQELDVTASSKLESNFYTASEELFEGDLVHSLFIQKNIISDQKWNCNIYKYSDLYFHSKSISYFKNSRFIIPGLEHKNIIFPFHDFI